MLACYNETGDSMNTFLETDFVISGIRLCCKVSDENGTSIHRNRASHGLVLLVEGGSRFDFLGGRTVMVEKGQVIYLPKFSNYDSTDAPGAVCIAINFDLVDGELTFPPFSLSSSFGDKYKPLFEKILQMWKQQRASFRNGCLGILYQIIHHIQQDAGQEHKAYGHTALLETCVCYITDNLADPGLSVERTAKHAAISEEYLRRIFRAKYGVSPKEYILLKRLEQAKAMIEYGDIKLNCIPFECGFTDYPYFSRMFKQRVGTPPLQYLKQMRYGKEQER